MELNAKCVFGSLTQEQVAEESVQAWPYVYVVFLSLSQDELLKQAQESPDLILV